MTKQQKVSFGGDTTARVSWKCEFLGSQKRCGCGCGRRLERGITSLLLVEKPFQCLDSIQNFPNRQKWQNFDKEKMNV